MLRILVEREQSFILGQLYELKLLVFEMALLRVEGIQNCINQKSKIKSVQCEAYNANKTQTSVTKSIHLSSLKFIAMGGGGSRVA